MKQKWDNPVCFIPSHSIFGDAWKIENMTSISDNKIKEIRDKELKRNEKY